MTLECTDEVEEEFANCIKTTCNRCTPAVAQCCKEQWLSCTLVKLCKKFHNVFMCPALDLC